MNAFMQYRLDLMRDCDKIYTYEFTSNSGNIDKEPIDWMTEEDYQHSRRIDEAKEYGIGYRRWKNYS